MSKTICIFGDSITWGACDYRLGGYCSRLKVFFQASEYDISIYNCGISGDNTNDLLKRFKDEATAREPQTIIFAIGVNDSQYIDSKDNPQVTMEKFEENLQKLIDQAKDITDDIIFLGLFGLDESKTMPTPWNLNKYYDNENIKLYNAKIEEVAKKNIIDFIDMIGLLDKDHLEDGLHPNDEGHKQIFMKVRDHLVNRI